MAESDSSLLKACSTCGELKPAPDYFKDKSRPDGLNLSCKPCMSAKAKKWRSANHEKAKGYEQKWRDANKEKARVRSKRWRQTYPEKARAQAASWRKANPEKLRLITWVQHFRDRLKPHHRIEKVMREGIRKSLRGGKAGRSWQALAGYTGDALREHLERQFLKGMTWDNYGEWHLDHITPLSSLKYQTAECQDFKAAWSLANLRPIWAKENLRKHAKRVYLL